MHWDSSVNRGVANYFYEPNPSLLVKCYDNASVYHIWVNRQALILNYIHITRLFIFRNAKVLICIIQGWSWLENKITEINENIAETIYTPFQNGHFWPVPTVQQFSENNIQETMKTLWDRYNPYTL